MKPMRRTLTTLVALAGMGTVPCVLAQTRSLCVYDPAGMGGEAWRAGQDYRLEMAQQGVDMSLKAYTNERVVVEDFKTSQCDAIMATGIRTRQFNGVASALDAVGAATVVRQGKVDIDGCFEVVRRFVEAMSAPKAADWMVYGPYEVAGILPLGAAYVFSNDRERTVLDQAKGRRVAALDHDKAQAEAIQRVGGTAVSADTMTFANMFNNGHVDMVVAPTMAYKPLELHRGVGNRGGVGRMPLTVLTYQLVIKAAQFPKGFGQKSREYMAQNHDLAIASLRLADRGVPAASWVDPAPVSVMKTLDVLKQVRTDMAEQGLYDKRGLKLAKRLRCQVAPDAAECANPDEL